MSANTVYKTGTICAMKTQHTNWAHMAPHPHPPWRCWMKSLASYCSQIVHGRMRSLSKITSQLASSKEFFCTPEALDCNYIVE